MGKEIAADETAEIVRNLSSIDDVGVGGGNALPLLALNHVSFLCKSVKRSVEFYTQLLGFVLIQRPSSFDFEGAWLFSHGIGIHLLQSETLVSKKRKINPKENHISFECSDMDMLLNKLEEMKIEHVKAQVKEGGIVVDQIFFHDPDGYMIEICNCQNLPVLPISSCPLKSKPTSAPAFYGNSQYCSTEADAMMLENLAMDMMSIII